MKDPMDSTAVGRALDPEVFANRKLIRCRSTTSPAPRAVHQPRRRPMTSIAFSLLRYFNDRVEAWDVAATSEDAYSLFHNSTP